MAVPEYHKKMRFQAYVIIFIAACMFLIQFVILFFEFGFNLISGLCFVGICASVYAISLEVRALGHIGKMDMLWDMMEKMKEVK